MKAAQQGKVPQQPQPVSRASRSTRRTIALMLLVPFALLAGCSATADPGSSVPRVLVGEWDGGSAGESDYQLSIAADGTYALFNQDQVSLRDEGYLEVAGDTLTMHSDDPGNEVHQYLGVQNCSWGVTEWTDYGVTMQILWLCGDSFSYLR